MAQSQFSLSWDSHQRNICAGLSALQQNGEFVDMTLAADGHHVKVHQVIMALASSYIKELIASANCPHPVIFLNKMSYFTLCSILEYIYTGEVVVSIENLDELVEAGKELHIKGLEEMKLQQTISSQQILPKTTHEDMEADELDELCYFEISNPKDDEDKIIIQSCTSLSEVTGSARIIEENVDDAYHDTIEMPEDSHEYINHPGRDNVAEKNISVQRPSSTNISIMQYTVSTQGSLQMILNRFVYFLKHSNQNGTKQWRCVDYLASSRCPAVVVTRDDAVVQRISAHTHSFHDKKILKKVQNGAIFTAIQEAVKEGENKKIKNPKYSKGVDK